MEALPASSKIQEAEVAVAWLRLILVIFNSIVYLALIYPAGVTWLAWTIIVVANTYAMLFAWLYSRVPATLKTGSWTTATDWALIVGWLIASGGPASPFFLVWGVSIAAIAYRFGPKETWIATGVYMASEATLLSYWGMLMEPIGISRVGYIGLAGAIGSSMAGVNLQARERAKMWQASRDELADKTARLGAVAENVPGTIMQLNLAGEIEFINKISPGFKRSQVVGQLATLFVPPNEAHILTDALESVAKTGEPAHYQIHAPTGEGMRTFQSDMGPIRRAGQVVGVVIHTNDVTEQLAQIKAAEEAKIDTIRLEQLEEQDKFRRDLLNSVAHELNTPLTPIKLRLYLLQKELGGHEAIGTLQRNINRLQRLVEDLLDIARMDNAELTVNPQPANLHGLLQDTVDTFAPLAAEHGVKIHLQADPELHGVFDTLRISQIMFNLVSNAIKFGAKNVYVKAEAAGDLTCTVSDDGPGFTDEQREKLFEPFQQIHLSKIADQPGTGLGLYLSRKIADAHQAKLTVMEDVGAKFKLVLPGNVKAEKPSQIREDSDYGRE